ncbi:5-oxoprolinase subunit PxpB [Bacillus sp. Marseille-P3661]|uniref:5-oxoprolinase subunit PxpB n=1 Tax=Bacillus sp. Marseille-P3661 TaxID=1936234 RepID=UPI000C8151D9|nr:5-oxoprolinase subunit PxpB [Bacillus sp. Marseille-P3661]
MNIQLRPLGDCAIRIEFSNMIDSETNKWIRRYTEKLRAESIKGIIEFVPAYTTIVIYYNPSTILYEELKSKLERINTILDDNFSIQANVYEIPVLYGGEFGMDLPFVADLNNLTEQEVIDIHSKTEYLIYMIGFVPGFPYLGGMSTKIAAPRLENPRAKVKAGSVGIAGKQTGIYPLEIPGGWRIIGRTPLKLFSPTNSRPVIFSAGDYLKFKPIAEDEYYSIEREIEKNCYQLRYWEKEYEKNEN